MRVSQIEVKKNITQFKGNEDYTPYITWGNGDASKIGTLLTSPKDGKVNISGLRTINFTSIKEEILHIVNQLDKLGYNSYACNLTRDDCCGNVVRVIVPGYQDSIHSYLYNTKRMISLPNFLKQKTRDNLFKEKLFT